MKKSGLRELSDKEMDEINASIREGFAAEEKKGTCESKWKNMSLVEKVEELKKRLDSLEALNTPLAS